MQSHFSLFRSHLEAVHFFWEAHLKHHAGNILDATLGQGKDSFYLAEIALENPSSPFHQNRKLFAVDIQKQSLDAARLMLEKGLPQQVMQKISLIQSCHSDLNFSAMSPLTLIVYNLGYLPGGDKSITTQTATTQKSIELALDVVSDGGMITITCYPGHDEGKNELIMLCDYLWNLPKKKWSVTHLQFAKETSSAPTLWVIQKSISAEI